MISLVKAGVHDCNEIHQMQIVSFKELLDKYQDVKTNSGAEPITYIVRRMEQECNDYYFITLDGHHIGVIRILSLDNNRSRIAPMFMLPKFQGKGYAQQVIQQVEHLYPSTKVWELDTIKQERKLCHLYEKIWYLPTGKEEIIQEEMTIIFYEKHSK